MSRRPGSTPWGRRRTQVPVRADGYIPSGLTSLGDNAAKRKAIPGKEERVVRLFTQRCIVHPVGVVRLLVAVTNHLFFLNCNSAHRRSLAKLYAAFLLDAGLLDSVQLAL